MSSSYAYFTQDPRPFFKKRVVSEEEFEKIASENQFLAGQQYIIEDEDVPTVVKALRKEIETKLGDLKKLADELAKTEPNKQNDSDEAPKLQLNIGEDVSKGNTEASKDLEKLPHVDATLVDVGVIFKEVEGVGGLLVEEGGAENSADDPSDFEGGNDREADPSTSDGREILPEDEPCAGGGEKVPEGNPNNGEKGQKGTKRKQSTGKDGEPLKKAKKNEKIFKQKPEGYIFKPCLLINISGCKGEALYKRADVEEEPFICSDHMEKSLQVLWRGMIEENFDQFKKVKAFKMEQVYAANKGRRRNDYRCLAPRNKSMKELQQQVQSLTEELQGSVELNHNLEAWVSSAEVEKDDMKVKLQECEASNWALTKQIAAATTDLKLQQNWLLWCVNIFKASGVEIPDELQRLVSLQVPGI